MKRHILYAYLVVFILALLPVAYLAIIFPSIPQTVPMHFNSHFQPDRYDDKSALWISVSTISAVSLLVYILLRNIQNIDPKRRNKPKSLVFSKIAIGLVIFLTAINFLSIIAIARQSPAMFKNLLFPLMGLFIAFIGNYMNNLKPNYFAGIRLPWTLSDNENWKKTHFLAGKLWFWGGLILTVFSLLVSFDTILPVYIAIIFILTLIPVIYSYRLFKTHTQNSLKD